jgi:hypothetical protein
MRLKVHPIGKLKTSSGGAAEEPPGRTAGKNGLPFLNLYLQLPESDRVLANLREAQ